MTSKTLKTNFGPDGFGYLEVTLADEREAAAGCTDVTIAIEGRVVVRGYVCCGEIQADGENDSIADSLCTPDGDLNRRGLGVFRVAEELIRSGRSDYFPSPS